MKDEMKFEQCDYKVIYFLLITLNIKCAKSLDVQVVHTFNLIFVNFKHSASSFLAHTSDIDDLLEGLDGVLEDWLDRLHDTESSLHIVDLWLHTLDGLHLSGDLNEWLSIIESLEDSGGEGLLDVLDGGGLGNGGIGITSGLRSLGGGEGGLEVNEELVFVHVLEVNGGNGGDESSGEFHLVNLLIIKICTSNTHKLPI